MEKLNEKVISFLCNNTLIDVSRYLIENGSDAEINDFKIHLNLFKTDIMLAELEFVLTANENQLNELSKSTTDLNKIINQRCDPEEIKPAFIVSNNGIYKRIG